MFKLANQLLLFSATKGSNQPLAVARMVDKVAGINIAPDSNAI